METLGRFFVVALSQNNITHYLASDFKWTDSMLDARAYENRETAIRHAGYANTEAGEHWKDVSVIQVTHVCGSPRRVTRRETAERV